MDAATCIRKLGYVGVLSFATVDSVGNPQVRNISAIHYESGSIRFFTAKGKDFCRELLARPNVQILGYTMYKEMIRISGQAKPVREDMQQHWIARIFAEQPYLENVYPRDTGKMAGIVFEIVDMGIEYFNLAVHPIFRETYAVGNWKMVQKGYFITDSCIGCGTCVENCPQSCIESGTPYTIRAEHCLRCGNCFSCCPVGAIKHLAQ